MLVEGLRQVFGTLTVEGTVRKGGLGRIQTSKELGVVGVAITNSTLRLPDSQKLEDHITPQGTRLTKGQQPVTEHGIFVPREVSRTTTSCNTGRNFTLNTSLYLEGSFWHQPSGYNPDELELQDGFEAKTNERGQLFYAAATLAVANFHDEQPSIVTINAQLSRGLGEL